MNALGVSEVTLSKLSSMHTNDEISDTDIRFLHCILYRKLLDRKKKANQRARLKRRNFSSGNRSPMASHSTKEISLILAVASNSSPKDGICKNRSVLRTRRNAASTSSITRSFSCSSMVWKRDFSTAGRYCFGSNYKYGSPEQNCILHTPFIARSIIVSTILRSPSRNGEKETEQEREKERGGCRQQLHLLRFCSLFVGGAIALFPSISVTSSTQPPAPIDTNPTSP